MMYLSAFLGISVFLLIFYVIHQSTKIGELLVRIEQHKVDLKTANAKLTEYQKTQEKANEIQSGPISTSIGDAIDSM